MHNKINETISTEFNSIVFVTLYLVYFCSLINLIKQLIKFWCAFFIFHLHVDDQRSEICL